MQLLAQQLEVTLTKHGKYLLALASNKFVSVSETDLAKTRHATEFDRRHPFYLIFGGISSINTAKMYTLGNNIPSEADK